MSRAVPRYRRNNQQLPPVPVNSFRLTLLGQHDIQNTINTFYYRDPDGSLSTYTNQFHVATAFATLILPTIVGFSSSDWTGIAIKSENLSNLSLVPYYLPLIGVSGAGPAGSEPSFVSLVCTRVTSVRSACGRGRVYIPAVPSAYISNGFILAGAAQAAAQAIVTAINATFTVSGKTMQPGLYSHGSRTHKSNGFADLVATSYNLQVGTARRRKIGRGK